MLLKRKGVRLDFPPRLETFGGRRKGGPAWRDRRNPDSRPLFFRPPAMVAATSRKLRGARATGIITSKRSSDLRL
jgi:hypothetical protein